MTKSELCEALVKRFTGISKRDMSMVVDALFDSLREALERGEAVGLRGFGRLTVKKRAPLKARNPRTDVAVDVPSRWLIHFKPASSLVEKVNQASR
ncbi:MAG: integration host factor subunit beta [Deltaproteobacteria bacterium]|nr:integration host factor subunit beta [Deltaproteobacteria bacterium]